MDLIWYSVISASFGSFAIPFLVKILKLENRWAKREIMVSLSKRNILLSSIVTIPLALLITSGLSPIVTLSIALSINSLLIASLVDWSSCKIPNELLGISAVSSIIGIAFSFSLNNLMLMGITLAFILLATTVTNFLTKGKLGAGDTKLLLALGLMTYWLNPTTIFYGILISFFLQLILRKIWISQQQDKTIKGAPFGYALTLGCLAAFTIL